MMLFSKSDKSVVRGILHVTDANVVSDTIFNDGEHDVYQDHQRYLHLYRMFKYLILDSVYAI